MRSHSKFLFLAVGLGLASISAGLVAGCGSDSDTVATDGSGTGTAGTSAAGTSAAGTSAAGTSAAGTSAAGTSAAGTSAAGTSAAGSGAGGSDTSGPSGAVSIQNTSAASYYASASFFDGGSVATEGCTTKTVGACSVATCDFSNAGGGGAAGAGGAPAAKNAGDITIKGGVEDVTLSPDASTGLYAAQIGNGKAYFKDGDTLSFSAVGAEIPAFSGTVDAPGAITLSAPMFPAPGTMYSLDTTADLDFTWTGGTGAKVLVNFTSASATKDVIISCTFDGASGTGKVPSSGGLDQLDKDATSISYSVSESAAVTVQAGDYSVALNAGAPVTTGTATIQ